MATSKQTVILQALTAMKELAIEVKTAALYKFADEAAEREKMGVDFRYDSYSEAGLAMPGTCRRFAAFLPDYCEKTCSGRNLFHADENSHIHIAGISPILFLFTGTGGCPLNKILQHETFFGVMPVAMWLDNGNFGASRNGFREAN